MALFGGLSRAAQDAGADPATPSTVRGGASARWRRSAVGARRHHPEVDRVLLRHAHFQRLERGPVTHAEVVRDHTGARLQIAKELGSQPKVHLGQQKECDDGGLADFGLEQILLEELHLFGDTGLDGILARLPDSRRVDVDADAADAEPLGGGDDDAAVAGAETTDSRTASARVRARSGR